MIEVSSPGPAEQITTSASFKDREASLKARLVVVETVYCQSPGEQPVAVESRFGRALNSQEQPYRRVIKVGESWQPLDHGWVEEASMLVISNEEGKYLQVVPTEEQRKELETKVVELAFPGQSGCWLIPPGDSFRGCPSGLGSLLVRCRKGMSKCVVHVFPK